MIFFPSFLFISTPARPASTTHFWMMRPLSSHNAGGVRTNMYGSLPRPLLSKSGFQGCIASFETNGELEDPIKHALVPSPLVEEGCEGNFHRF